MFVLRWKHTRTGKDMEAEFTSYGQAWLRAMLIWELFPNHKLTLDGKPLAKSVKKSQEPA